jgi:hypothetical protein
VGNKIQCLQPTLTSADSNSSLDPNTEISDSNLLWPTVIDLYGTLRPGVSQLRLEQENGTEVIGTIALDPSDDRFVIFDPDIDTVPANTLPPINAIIDPLVSGPGAGLPAATNGQRYLLVESTGNVSNSSNPLAWIGENTRPLVAQANDIIEYQNGYWKPIFIARVQAPGQYVTNITTGVQYEWTSAGWVKSYQGVYPGGTWSLVL